MAYDLGIVVTERPPYFDLPGYVAYRLRQSGIGKIETMPRCTYLDAEDYFSYRRTTHRKEADYGRQLSAIMLKD